MAKYCALLYREWRISRKYYLTSYLFLLLFMVFLWLLALSTQIGNLTSLMEDEEAAELLHLYIRIGMPYFVAFAAITVSQAENGVFRADLTTNWLRYSFAMPYTAKLRTTVRLTLSLGSVAVSYLLSVLNTVVIYRIMGYSLDGKMFLYFLLLLDLSLLIGIIQQAFLLRARSLTEWKKQTAKSVVLLIALYLGVIFAISSKITVIAAERAKQAQEYMDNAFIVDDDAVEMIIFNGLKEDLLGWVDRVEPFLLPAAILLIAGLWFITWRAFERREK